MQDSTVGLRRAGAVIVALVWLSGCVGAPVQEMSDARQAIAAAQDAGAQRYASPSFEQAQSLLSSAEDKLQRRDYRGARDDARSAHLKAVEAMETAKVAADRD